MPRIAILDGSRLARAYAAGALRAGGHEPVELEPGSVETVVDLLKAQPVALLMADSQDPACPGESLVQACRRDPLLRDLPILLVAAPAEGVAPAPGDLTRPLAARVLVDRVDQALGA